MQRVIILLLAISLLAAGCRPAPPASLTARLVFVQDDRLVTMTNFAPGAALEPGPPDFTPPAGCSIHSLHPAPRGTYLAVLLDCAGGPLTLVVDLASGTSGSPLEEPVDTHFLAWGANGTELYLLADSFNEPRVLRIDLRRGDARRLPLPASTYALACSPDARTMVYARTPGLGYGSELWQADLDGKNARRLLAEPGSILALPRWSPDGNQLAYIRMPDTQIPFPNGELWLLDMAGTRSRFLSEADAGHGYAPAWSPDGNRIAFVVRENPADPLVLQTAGNLRSNIHVLEVETGRSSGMTRLQDARVGAPAWAPDSRSLVFAAGIDGKMSLWAYDMAADETNSLAGAGACCPVWIGK